MGVINLLLTVQMKHLYTPTEIQTHKGGPFGSKLSFSWGPPGTENYHLAGDPLELKTVI